MDKDSQTLGQKRVKAEFNPAKNGTVDQLKNISAKMIDIALKGGDKDSSMKECKNSFMSLINSDSKGGTSERERLQSIAFRHMDSAFDNWVAVEYGTNDSVDIVTERIETACMYAVKWCFTE